VKATELNRRDFLKLTGTAAAAAALAACAPSTTTPTTSGAASAGATAAVKRGGTLTWTQALDNVILDPPLFGQGGSVEITGDLFDSLVALDPDLNIKPWLATRWTVENDAKKYTFTLRNDVKFHDGTALDSTAVKRTIERIADPATKAAQVSTALGALDHAEAPDPQTVILFFKESNPLLLLQLWKSWYGIISPKQLDTLKPGEVIQSPIGSGPFKFVSRSADGVTTIAANPDYKWGPEFRKNRATPYLDSIKFRRVAEASTRTATLESGESLFIDDVPEADYARLKNDKRFTFVQLGRKGPGYGFQFNMKKAPVSDLAVRQAMNWAVDRQGIVDKVLFGVHHPTVGPLQEGVWGRLDELEKTIPYSGDKKKAADILEAAGWKVGAGGIREKGGQRLSLVLAAVAGAVPQNDLADALVLQVREIGIDLQVQKMPINNWFDFVRAYKHDLVDTAGANLDPDELRLRYHSKSIGGVNYANLSDPQLDDLLVKGQLAPFGSDQRRQIYADVQRRLMDLLPMLSMITVIRTVGMSNKVKDLRLNPQAINAYPATDVWIDS
jgi:peptide/nickel transport system substrate-binding protein